MSKAMKKFSLFTSQMKIVSFDALVLIYTHEIYKQNILPDIDYSTYTNSCYFRIFTFQLCAVLPTSHRDSTLIHPAVWFNLD